MKTYLSIDLDYWNIRNAPLDAFKTLDTVFQKFESVPVVVHHHQLLPHINKSEAQRLINLDEHDDTCPPASGKELKDPDYLCASWVNNVRWRKGGDYIWAPPKNLSRCIGGHWDPDHDLSNGYIFKPEWKTIRLDKNLTSICWDDVVAAGIAISPDWLDGFFSIEILKFVMERGNLKRGTKTTFRNIIRDIRRMEAPIFIPKEVA